MKKLNKIAYLFSNPQDEIITAFIKPLPKANRGDKFRWFLQQRAWYVNIVEEVD